MEGEDIMQIYADCIVDSVILDTLQSVKDHLISLDNMSAYFQGAMKGLEKVQMLSYEQKQQFIDKFEVTYTEELDENLCGFQFLIEIKFDNENKKIMQYHCFCYEYNQQLYAEMYDNRIVHIDTDMNVSLTNLITEIAAYKTYQFSNKKIMRENLLKFFAGAAHFVISAFDMYYTIPDLPAGRYIIQLLRYQAVEE